MGLIGEPGTRGMGGFSVDGMRIVSYSDTWEHHTIVRKCNIIFELDGNYYYIIENMDKLVEICSMPDYLQKEWFHHNKKVLTESKTPEQVFTKHSTDIKKYIIACKTIQFLLSKHQRKHVQKK